MRKDVLKGNSTFRHNGLKSTFMFNKVTYIAWNWQFRRNNEDVCR